MAKKSMRNSKLNNIDVRTLQKCFATFDVNARNRVFDEISRCEKIHSQLYTKTMKKVLVVKFSDYHFDNRNRFHKVTHKITNFSHFSTFFAKKRATFNASIFTCDESYKNEILCF